MIKEGAENKMSNIVISMQGKAVEFRIKEFGIDKGWKIQRLAT